ncbi:MAG TPA: hypothetical protein VFQ45_09090, partial [Longimicrobium sp.]|nr:hypothetical protein [Longimicrobium sp.]
MDQRDSNGFLTAFVVGTALGVGATLLLRPRKQSARARLVREMKKQGARRKGGGARAAVRIPRLDEDRPARRDLRARDTDELIDAGRELLGEFRAEVARILEDAREELRDIARESAG